MIFLWIFSALMVGAFTAGCVYEIFKAIKKTLNKKSPSEQ